jgi:hypothetical protein
MKEPFKVDYIYAGICLIGAVYFMFRSWGIDKINLISIVM